MSTIREKGILSWIEKNGLGKPTGRREQSGFVEYLGYHFDSKRLQELDDLGNQKYSQAFDQVNRGWRQERKKRQER